MKYDVHIYAVVRIKVRGIEAATPSEAAEKAEASVNTNELFPDTEHASGLFTADSEETVGYLVDPLDATGEPLTEEAVLLDANRVQEVAK